MPQDLQSGKLDPASQMKMWFDAEINKDVLMTDTGAFHADSPSVAGGAKKWAEYYQGERLLLISRDDRLWVIHHDASLTRAQKYEQSKALFESTNRIESFLAGSMSPVAY